MTWKWSSAACFQTVCRRDLLLSRPPAMPWPSTKVSKSSGTIVIKTYHKVHFLRLLKSYSKNKFHFQQTMLIRLFKHIIVGQGVWNVLRIGSVVAGDFCPFSALLPCQGRPRDMHTWSRHDIIGNQFCSETIEKDARRRIMVLVCWCSAPSNR